MRFPYIDKKQVLTYGYLGKNFKITGILTMECKQINYSGHAIRRMFERGISESDVSSIISCGEVIVEYPDDTPYPSYLILGFLKDHPLHVLIGMDKDTNSCFVITTYIPNPKIWNDDYKTRRTLP